MTKFNKAQQIKDMIFSLARKAQYTRKEIQALLESSFSEYKKSTISTYISDSFNSKYVNVTGCKRKLKYTLVANKKIVTTD